MQVICPYCNQEAKLVDSAVIYRGVSYGNIWLCKPCDAYNGVHPDGKNTPKGSLANRELRLWRKNAHAVFDVLWKSKKMTRKQAYQYMQKIMGLDGHTAHIGAFNLHQCKELVNKINFPPITVESFLQQNRIS